MADVFISYHMESAGKLARKIADKLETIGISCWYANRDMLPGQFVESIMDAINQCKIFLLILNEEANHSKYVFNELSNAYRRFVYLRPHGPPYKALEGETRRKAPL